MKFFDNVLMGKDYMTIKEVSEYFNISEATVRNWIKLGKLHLKEESVKKVISFSEIEKVSGDIESSKKLTSRRNKTRQGSNYIPRKYIPHESPNFRTIVKIISFLEINPLPIEDVIAHYAEKLMLQNNLSDIVLNTLIFDGQNRKINSADLSDYSLSYIPCEDTLGLLYISLRRLQDKKATGSYYTPFFAVDLLLENLPDEPQSICDPSCGTGNFLLRLPNDYPLDLIYGYDIDPMAIKIARINLALKYKIKTKEQLDTITRNIISLDYLAPDKRPKKYNYIIGNPPWGSSFSKSQLCILKENFECADIKGKPESFNLFVEKAIKSLSLDGTMIFLLPEAILGAGYHEIIRNIIKKYANVAAISYLGDIFYKVQCPCIILKLTKEKTDTIKISHYNKLSKDKLVCNKTYLATKDRISDKSFHILSGDVERSITDKILSTPHFTLNGNADFALGIVTGSNKSFLSSSPLEGFEGILKGSDIHKYYYDEPSNFIKFEPERFQQVAPNSFYRAKEKLFYKFIANEPVFAYDNKGTLSLNSANILIPKIQDYSALYIMAILNSDVMSFYYKNTFRNLKVLKSAIEALPIAYCDKDTMKYIEALAGNISANPKDRAGIVSEINDKIRMLYRLSKNDIL